MQADATGDYSDGVMRLEISHGGVLIGRWVIRARRVSDVQRAMLVEGWRVELRKTTAGGSRWRGRATRPQQ
ncbi:hypothetical protein F8O06_02655 [Pseudoclavibacter sp. CFCC 14310]|uniref:hypothetical protein n=1 Tax=Pseudoclavibacter sp. CFCC 14310 TaxID=2615180 RepID=UPI0013014BD8|nr:hypothetical protein [Pseudoclavibacter sp. CFCC 14310]KAB1647457.1 hypothetical protein F8O06_02655 [Pseudoclavibacter sp. CFCC 14310]